MIALTQEKRESEIQKIKEKIGQINGDMDIGWNAEEYLLLPLEIALASLTADIFAHVDGSGFNFYRHPSPTIEHALEQGDQVTSLYTAPPVPEINKDDYIGLHVSVDVSTCDDDAGHRYFGKVSALSESNGEIVLVIEESERNFTAPPVPEIKFPRMKGYAEPHTQYSEGVVDGYNRCLADIKRLNGWEE